MEIMDEVTAADDEDAFLPQGRNALADFVVVRRGLSFANAQLNDWNIRVRVRVAQNRPRAVVEPPPFIEPHRQWREQLLNANREVWVAGRCILNLIKFSREAAEIVDCPWSCAHGHGSILNVPMCRHAQDSLRSRESCSNRCPLFGVEVVEQGVHRISVAKEN
jgi:hypothetical protein